VFFLLFPYYLAKFDRCQPGIVGNHLRCSPKPDSGQIVPNLLKTGHFPIGRRPRRKRKKLKEKHVKKQLDKKGFILYYNFCKPYHE